MTVLKRLPAYATGLGFAIGLATVAVSRDWSGVRTLAWGLIVIAFYVVLILVPYLVREQTRSVHRDEQLQSEPEPERFVSPASVPSVQKLLKEDADEFTNTRTGGTRRPLVPVIQTELEPWWSHTSSVGRGSGLSMIRLTPEETPHLGRSNDELIKNFITITVDEFIRSEVGPTNGGSEEKELTAPNAGKEISSPARTRPPGVAVAHSG